MIFNEDWGNYSVWFVLILFRLQRKFLLFIIFSGIHWKKEEDDKATIQQVLLNNCSWSGQLQTIQYLVPISLNLFHLWYLQEVEAEWFWCLPCWFALTTCQIVVWGLRLKEKPTIFLLRHCMLSKAKGAIGHSIARNLYVVKWFVKEKEFVGNWLKDSFNLEGKPVTCQVQVELFSSCDDEG